MEHDQIKPRRQRHGPPLGRAAIQEERGAGHAARFRELVHQAAHHPDVAVLGALAASRELEPIDRRGALVEHRPRRGELDGRRR